VTAKIVGIICYCSLIAMLGYGAIAQDGPTIPDLIEPAPKREAVEIKVETPYEVVSDANLVLMSNAPNARVDIYRIGFIKRGRKSIELNGEVLGATEPFVDCVAKQTAGETTKSS
jgi:hypothetical protein